MVETTSLCLQYESVHQRTRNNSKLERVFCSMNYGETDICNDWESLEPYVHFCHDSLSWIYLSKLCA